jgi:NAD(P)H-dependent FMN reductase
MNHPKILCFAGSNRSGSYNKALAGAMAKQLSLLDCEVTLISFQDYPLPLFDQDEEAEKGVPDNAVKLAALLASHDGVFIASPEYNSSLTPLLKNTIDWISRVPATDPHPFRSPVFAIGGASPGALGGIRALAHLRQVLVTLGALVLPQQVSIASAHSAFDEVGDLSDGRSAAFLVDVANSLLTHSKRF